MYLKDISSAEGKGGERDLEFVAKVIDEMSGSGSGEVIVEPSEKEETVLREKLQETSHVLGLLQQSHELRKILPKDLIEGKLDLGDLPEQAREGDWAEGREGGGR